MKTSIITLGLFIFLCGCQSSTESLRASAADSAPLAAAPPPQLDPVEAKRYNDMVSDFVDKHLSERYFNGGILVAKNGVVVYERYTGFSNLRTKDSMTAETSLQVASTGKTLTSGAILKLVQEGKMGLDDLVTKFFPGFPYPEVTVKMLLNHRSGLPNYLYYMEKMGWNKKQTATNEDVINTLIQWKPSQAYRPGTRYNYCNTNYVVLASIVEKVSGQSFPQYMKEQFFVPLGMNNSFVKTQGDSASVVYSYQANGALWPPDFTDGPYGDKNIYSTPRDLLKWDQALRTDSLFTKQSLDAAYMPYSFEKPGTHNYGLGWRMYLLKNGKKLIY
ncbi:MAG TPA: serine hydrolase domain-containing protein, partial [Flavisolibacter sp.]|nr:serine hydrolase domain-containing protein [Flavisolibacter sp.]